MPDINIQFYAIPEELAPLSANISIDLQLHVVGMKFFPFRATEIQREQLSHAIMDGSYERFAFTQTKPLLSVAFQGEFLDRNPCALILDVGRPTAAGLKQSWLACRTFETAMPDAWQKFAKKLRSITKAGAIAIDPDTEAKAVVRHLRYTPGAKALNNAGMAMLPAAGGTVLKLGLDAAK